VADISVYANLRVKGCKIMCLLLIKNDSVMCCLLFMHLMVHVLSTFIKIKSTVELLIGEWGCLDN